MTRVLKKNEIEFINTLNFYTQMNVVSFKVISLRSHRYSNDGADAQNIFGTLLFEYLSKPKKILCQYLQRWQMFNIYVWILFLRIATWGNKAGE